jgi:MerR family transcriptional regulator, heat shock protein HspR
MSRSRPIRPSARRWADVVIEAEASAEPRYALTAVAARTGVHVQTVRRYEAYGLIEATSIGPGLRLYSEADVARVRRIKRLVDDLGVNLAGAAAILHLREQLVGLQRELIALREYRPDRDRDI